MADAVVRDGDGRMPPGRRPLNDLLDVGGGIHHRHAGVQVELHPLLPFRLVLADGPRPLRNTGGFDLQLPLVGANPALDHKALPLPDGPGQLLAFVSDQKFGHPDGIGLIRDVKADDPRASLLHFQMVGGEYISFNGHHFGVQGDVVHGDGGKFFHHTAVN